MDLSPQTQAARKRRSFYALRYEEPGAMFCEVWKFPTRILREQRVRSWRKNDDFVIEVSRDTAMARNASAMLFNRYRIASETEPDRIADFNDFCISESE